MALHLGAEWPHCKVNARLAGGENRNVPIVKADISFSQTILLLFIFPARQSEDEQKDARFHEADPNSGVLGCCVCVRTLLRCGDDCTYLCEESSRFSDSLAQTRCCVYGFSRVEVSETSFLKTFKDRKYILKKEGIKRAVFCNINSRDEYKTSKL